MTHRIQSRWKTGRGISGIRCDRILSLRVNGNVYKLVVRSAMMYSAETRALKKAQAKKLDVAEMRMLRWMSGVYKLDRITNGIIRGTTKVGEIIQESAEKWVEVGWACIENRRRMRKQECDGDGGVGEKKERNTKVELVG